MTGLLAQAFPGVQQIEPLRAEVSARRYFRVHLASRTAVAAIYPGALADDDDFLRIQEILKQGGLRVPGILDRRLDQGILLLEDAGDTDLGMALARATEPETMRLLCQAIDSIAALQQLRPLSPIAERFFDLDKLWWEMEYTFRGLALAWPDLDGQTITFGARTFLEEICQYLATRALFVTHRDFHSRNLMVRDDALILIDFQDARMGSCYYDLVSLLYDPYTSVPASTVDSCVQYYIDTVLPLLKTKHSKHHFYCQAVQRLFKALGTYAQQLFSRGDASFRPALHACLERLDLVVQRSTFPDALYLFIQELRRRAVALS
ncbi:MAG: phosphotransferase [Spirochaetales bacterium]|nr:phosphotransferase [Spirochaetales bacterium]